MRAILILALCSAGSVLSSDVCDLEFDKGPCKGMENVVAFEDGKCVPKLYGGCRGNENRFSSISECESTCSSKLTTKFYSRNPICEKPGVEGRRRCRGWFVRFTFNAAAGKCEEIVYGGCGATENMFLSMTDCVSACMEEEEEEEDVPPSPRTALDTSDTDEDICSLPPVLPGPIGCLAFIPKWTYSRSEGACVKFTYGGCRGTENLFNSEAECEAQCGNRSSSSAEVCSLDIQPGPCKQKLPTFGFNQQTGRCESFNYGGCRGNGNRFSTMEDCVATCGGSEPVSVSNCEGVLCDKNMHKLQEMKGCQPVTKPGECCPSSWDCSSWERRLEQMDKCWYGGQLYNPGERIVAVTEDNSCSQGCYCDNSSPGQPPVITCAFVDCFNPRDFSWDSCRPNYRDLSTCCFSNYTCGPELQQRSTCQMNGKTYYDGEKMYPESDPCTVCHCKPGWDGELEGEFCEQIKCSILGREEELLRGCQPLYRDNVCCPYEWICPDELEFSTPPDTRASPAIKENDKCLLPKVVGPCKMIKPMFYFDINSGSCQSFNYGGCKGNENKFSSKAECEETCHSFIQERQPRIIQGVKAQPPPPAKPTNNICSQPVAIGPCKSRLEKFYYDYVSGVCKKFYYSGCRGGKNMFDTMDECSSSCVQPGKLSRGPAVEEMTSPCQGPKDQGPCRAAMPRWFYNKQSEKCEMFLYGGCQGNANNFLKKTECEERCLTGSSDQVSISSLPAGLSRQPEPAGGRSCPGCPVTSTITPDIKMVAAKGVKIKELSDLLSGNCEHLVLKEISDVKTQVVAGTNYIFSMKLETKSGSQCDLKVTRTCTDITIFKPWSCDTAEDCLELVFQERISCGEDEIDISSILLPGPVIGNDEEADPCFQERMVGRCKGALKRFYFHAETKTCRSFLYGGCLGNENNFADLGSCEETCGKHMTQATPRNLRPTPTNQICRLPMEAGPCYALKPRFFFNFQSRRCEQFIYGGCRGNENNFPSMQECVSACGKHPRGLPRGPVGPVTLPAREPRCQFGNHSLALGDILRLPGDDCKSCACLTPPDVTCSITRCPMKAFLPPPGGVNCVMQRDNLGCCETGYKCDSQAPPVVGGGGGYPVLGGYGANEPLGPEQKKIAVTVANKILTGVSGVTECGDLTLLEVTHFSRQIVAGTNFKLSLRLRTKCPEVSVRVCEEIVLYQPLPYQCTPGPDNNHCLTLSRPQDIRCSPE